ncbi:hypothetical protein DID78_00795 [Candidatus Marinamargulisbacteria bacterium SCGC AG-343-D04]|nr:hypothetical protein DID78_00795 [Candidatus Marinamargulisbacteria bacterium SCGC AG-343-D04]
MLRFFREKAAYIGWGIVIFFVATMFTGGFFLGFGTNSEKNVKKENKEVFASLGEYSVDVRRFNQILQNSLFQYQQKGGRLSPLYEEQILLNAFKATLEDQVFHIAALQADIQLNSQERKSAETEFILENNIKSKKELKRMLKERNIPYKIFSNDLEKQMIVRKYKNNVIASVVVDDFVIENSFKDFKLDMFLVKKEGGAPETLQGISQEIFSDLFSLSQKDVIDKYQSIVTISFVKSDGFRSYTSFNHALRSSLVSFKKNVYLEPICSEGACFIPVVRDVKVNAKGEGYNEEKYAESLAGELRVQRLQEVLLDVLERYPLSIYSPEIKAVYSKSIGEYSEALTTYQQLLTANPSRFDIHFFRAQIFHLLDQYAEALKELEKADLKSQLKVEYDFPELHVFYGDLLKKKSTKEAVSQYDKAYELVQNDLDFLPLLQKRYEGIGHSKGVAQIDQRIAALEEERQKQDAALQKESENAGSVTPQ